MSSAWCSPINKYFISECLIHLQVRSLWTAPESKCDELRDVVDLSFLPYTWRAWSPHVFTTTAHRTAQSAHDTRTTSRSILDPSSSSVRLFLHRWPPSRSVFNLTQRVFLSCSPKKPWKLNCEDMLFNLLVRLCFWIDWLDEFSIDWCPALLLEPSWFFSK